MLVQIVDDRFLQPSGAESVNQPYRPLLREQSLIKKLLQAIERLVDSVADEQQIAWRYAFARLQLHIDADGGGCGFRRRAAQHTQFVGVRTEAFAADIHFRLSIVDVHDDTLQAEWTEDDAIADDNTASR